MVEALLGRSSQQIQISLLPFPDISASSVLKAHAFDHCLDAINTHRSKFEFAELSSFIHGRIPNSDGTALQQAVELGNTIREAVFDIRNLTCTGFLDSNNRRIADDELAKQPNLRPKNISLATFEATIDPGKYFPKGAELDGIRPRLVTYSLLLPQTTIDAYTGHEPASTNATPRQLTLADLTVDADGIPLSVGTATGSDTIVEYSQDVIDQLSADQLHYLHARSTGSKGLQSPRFSLRSSASSGSITTYTGDYMFLDNQHHFDQTFHTRMFVGEGAKTCNDRIVKFANECQYSVFTQLLRMDYVGSSKRVDIAHVNTLTSQLRKLKMTSKDDKGQGITNTEELFSAFLRIATLLPKDAGS